MELYNVIKYEGDNETFVWKHPCEDFNVGSVVIVHESQEAIFFKDGQALDLFGPGKHILNSENLPYLNKIISIPSNGESPFHCEVYFINKTEQMAIKWGTDNRVQYMDPKYNVPLKLGASGEMTLSVDNSRKLLVKLVGTELYLSRQRLTDYFRMFLMSKVKNYLVNVITTKKIGIFDIDTYILEISNMLKEQLQNDFLDYGINLNNFYVTSFVKPEEDAMYQRLKQMHADKFLSIEEANIRKQVDIIDEETLAQKRVIESQSIAEKRKIEGYTYQEEQGFDVAKELAKNEGVGNFTSAGIGLGVVSSVGNTVSTMMTNTISNTLNDNFKFCTNCGEKIGVNYNFCSKCGEKQ